MTHHKLPLQPSPEYAAQMRADRLRLAIEHPEGGRALPYLIDIGRNVSVPYVGPRIEFTGEKK